MADEKNMTTPAEVPFDVDRAVYMIEWRDREIARLKRQLDGVGDALNVAGAYIMVLAAERGLPVRIDKAEIAARIRELDGRIAWRDAGDAIIIEAAEEVEQADSVAEDGESTDGKETEEAQD